MHLPGSKIVKPLFRHQTKTGMGGTQYGLKDCLEKRKADDASCNFGSQKELSFCETIPLCSNFYKNSLRYLIDGYAFTRTVNLPGLQPGRLNFIMCNTIVPYSSRVVPGKPLR